MFNLSRDERAAEREHQLALVRELVRGIEVFADGQARVAEEHSKGLLRIAEALSAQAGALAEWFKSFQVSAAPTSSVVTDEDEWADEVRKHGGADIPPEFALALELHQKDFFDDVRRDNKP